MKIVTGYAGEAHITSNDDQGLLQGIFGTGNYILPVRNRFAATLISSNELQIADGEGLLQGVHFRVEPDTVDSVTIENGSQGMQRIDLVCARYEKNAETEIESVSWVVKKGTPAASNPATPSVTPGDLLAGDTLAEFPIYSIRLNGITIQSVTLLATILSPQSLIGNTSITGIGDGTITGALSALNASLSSLTARAGSTLSNPLSLSTTPQLVNCGGLSYNVGGVFTLVPDGGFRCAKQGRVRVNGFIHVTGVTSGDEIALAAGVYSGGWAYESYSARSKTITALLDIYVPVNANQTVYIRASNNSGIRGSVDSAQLSVEFLA